MKKLTKVLLSCLLLLAVLLPVSVVLTAGGEPVGPYLGLEYGKATGLGDQDVRLTVARIINSALGLLGIISVSIIIFAGFKWMTAGGNEEGIKEAKGMLIAATIGLAIILSAYAITRFVTTQLFKATTGVEYSAVMTDG